jgi:deazaflavin-dependent oxidoreductase (nitroreductase family)
MILTTKGRRTGRLRAAPVLYLRDEADLIVVALFGGNDMHSAWYLNLQSCPEAEVLVKGEHRRLVAHRVSAEEKERIWPRLVRMVLQFDVYQQRTNREISLLGLYRRRLIQTQ